MRVQHRVPTVEPVPPRDAREEAELRDLRRRLRDGTLAAADVQAVAASGTLALTRAQTVVVVDTTSGNVSLALPDPAERTGWQIAIKKGTAANTLTVTGTGPELPVAWATLNQTVRFAATGTAWVTI